MLSAAQNDRITRVGSDTPCGHLLRRCRQPVALTGELDGPRPLRAVRALGQDFVLFRDEAGRRRGTSGAGCCTMRARRPPSRRRR
jgi:hypothetical protein